MRLPAMLINLALISAISGCSNVPFMNNIPLWAEDPAKLDRLGKGATVADVDKAFGRSRVLWSKSLETTDTPTLFRLYDSVESTGVAVPYAVVFVGAEAKLEMWGTLSQLRDSGDAAVVAMLPELSSHYNEYRRMGR